MRKYFFLFLLFSVVVKLQAQTTPWIAHGATWHYSFWARDSSLGNDKIVYTADTIINGQLCQKLELTRYFYGYAAPNAPLTLNGSQHSILGYTYSSHDTVFYLKDAAFHILYNFAATAGNKWNLGHSGDTLLHCTESVTIVDSVSTTMINGNSHHVLYTSDSANSSVGVCGQFDLTWHRKPIVEHIGSLNYLFPTERNCNPNLEVDFYFFSFSCFSDSLESYSVIPVGDCNNPYHVGIDEYNSMNKEIQCFPNPVDNELMINFFKLGNYVISITDFQGNKVLETVSNSDFNYKIDISTLNSGIYFISFNNKSGIIKNEKFIKK